MTNSEFSRACSNPQTTKVGTCFQWSAHIPTPLPGHLPEAICVLSVPWKVLNSEHQLLFLSHVQIGNRVSLPVAWLLSLMYCSLV